MTDERLERVREAIAAAGGSYGLLTSSAAVAYATGFAPFGGAGASPFDAGPPVAIVTPESVDLIVADADVDAPVRDGIAVRSYHSFAPRRWRKDVWAAYIEAVMTAVGGGSSGPVAVERTLPAAVAERLPRRVFVDEALLRARLTKTRAEIASLRAAAELASLGQRVAIEVAEPGMTELELFGQIRGALETAAGAPLALGADLLSGERTLEVMGSPSNRVLCEGDPLLCDLVPRLGAYWGDSATTPVLGEPSVAFERIHATAQAALEHGVETARPGLTAGELDAAVRGVIERAGYVDPIHVGHGIGVTNFEQPRIVPEEPTRLEAGMVLMLEPTVVADGVAAARLEWMIALTDEGAELMSTHQQLLGRRAGVG